MEIKGHTVNGELSRFGRFLKRLRSDYLGLVVLAGLFAVGASGGWAAHGLFGNVVNVPDRLERIDDRLDRTAADVRYIMDLQQTMVTAFCHEPSSRELREACSIAAYLKSHRDRQLRDRR